MSPLSIHLYSNHIPVFFIAIGVLVYIAGLFLRAQIVEKVALVLMLIGGITIIPVFKSGEAAEHLIRSYPCRGMLTETHEQAADFALYWCLITAVASAVALGLAWKGKPFAFSKTMRGIIIFVALMTSSVVIRTAHLGGLIGHEEFHEGWQNKDPQNAYCPS